MKFRLKVKGPFQESSNMWEFLFIRGFLDNLRRRVEQR